MTGKDICTYNTRVVYWKEGYKAPTNGTVRGSLRVPTHSRYHNRYEVVTSSQLYQRIGCGLCTLIYCLLVHWTLVVHHVPEEKVTALCVAVV